MCWQLKTGSLLLEIIFANCTYPMAITHFNICCYLAECMDLAITRNLISPVPSSTAFQIAVSYEEFFRESKSWYVIMHLVNDECKHFEIYIQVRGKYISWVGSVLNCESSLKIK